MTAQATTDLLRRGIDAHRAGQLRAAETLYRQVLAQAPAYSDALNLMGVLYQNSGRLDAAIHYAVQAVALEPRNPDFLMNLGLAYEASKRHEDAVDAYRRALAVDPKNAEINNNLGVSLLSLKRDAEARVAFEQGVLLNPGHILVRYNLASVLRDLGELAAAETHFKEAVRLQPNLVQAVTGLAQIYDKLGRYAEAVESYRRALALNQNDIVALSGLSACLVRAERQSEAREVFQRLLTFTPEPKITLEYANALEAAGNVDEAIAVFRQALECDPHLIEARVSLGHALGDKGEVDLAIDAYERAMANGLSPDKGTFYTALALGNGQFFNSMLLFLDRAGVEESYAERAGVARSIALLTTGRLAEGWPHYNERLFTDKTKIHRRAEPPSYWKGEDLIGKTIYVWPEQGLGDQIIYGTMLPDLIARAGRVYFESKSRLEQVFRRSLPGALVLSNDSEETKAAVTAADYQIPLGSLGVYFRRRFEDFPRRAEYLKPDPEKVARFRARYEQLASGRRIVGLSWKSKKPRGGAGKSTRLMEWEPLLRTPDVLFVNLQYGDCSAELAEVKAKLGVEVFADMDVDPMGEMDNFFAQVAALDLVISTSNTTVHVAGSINVPCWVLLPRGAGALWYWFTEREDSPWYPSLRLFRPEGIGSGWAPELMPRLGQDLARWMEQGCGETGDR